MKITSKRFSQAYGDIQTVADWTFKTKYAEVTIDFEDPIDVDRLIYHIGPFIQSLKLVLFDNYTEDDLHNIQKTCSELKILILIGFERNDVQSNPFCGITDNLEMLTLAHCYLGNDEDILDSFTNLVSFNIVWCSDISSIAVQKCFQNNKGITSFVCDSTDLECSELVQQLPNLERLGLNYANREMDLSFIAKLKSLRSLRLHCNNENMNMNTLLSDLAGKIDLKELEIINVSVDEKTLEILKSFKTLQRLSITTFDYNLTSSNVLPLSLKTLELEGFRISVPQIVSLIEQREHLEDIHLADCINTPGFHSIAMSIIRQCKLKENRKVNLNLTTSADQSAKVNYRMLNHCIKALICKYFTYFYRKWLRVAPCQ